MTCVNVEIRYKISETSLRSEIYVVSRVKCADSEYQLKKCIVCLFLRVNGVDDCCREVALASIVGGLFKERAVGGRAIERRNERHRKSTEVKHYLD